jgi:DNA-binding transcriptional LysR family regulator
LRSPRSRCASPCPPVTRSRRHPARSTCALAGRDFIGFSRIAELRTAVTGILDEADVTVNVTFESSEIDTMRSLVAGGLGVSILPRTPGRDDPGVVYLPLEPQRVRAIGIAWSTTAQGSATRRSWSPRCGSGEWSCGWAWRCRVVVARWARRTMNASGVHTSSTRPRN